MLNGNPIATPSVVVRKSLFAQIDYMIEDPEMAMTSDYHTWLKLANITDAFLHIPSKLGYYRIHDNNFSSDSILKPTIKAMNEFFLQLTEKQKSEVINNLTYTQGRVKFINKYYINAAEDLKQVVKVGKVLNKIKSLVMLAQIRVIVYFNKSKSH